MPSPQTLADAPVPDPGATEADPLAPPKELADRGNSINSIDWGRASLLHPRHILVDRVVARRAKRAPLHDGPRVRPFLDLR